MCPVWRTALIYFDCDLLLLFSDEVRLAARMLFDAGVDSLTDEETISLVGRWQHSRKALAICRAWL
jgi:hypothetical protein